MTIENPHFQPEFQAKDIYPLVVRRLSAKRNGPSLIPEFDNRKLLGIFSHRWIQYEEAMSRLETEDSTHSLRKKLLNKGFRFSDPMQYIQHYLVLTSIRTERIIRKLEQEQYIDYRTPLEDELQELRAMNTLMEDTLSVVPTLLPKKALELPEPPVARRLAIMFPLVNMEGNKNFQEYCALPKTKIYASRR
ncbi:hypothetical protein HGB07_05140 [Candidatus Roizmanbacteria bacterium]|nr:hypothetical protein [Candidatus Roizmanbacteria bacterium]